MPQTFKSWSLLSIPTGRGRLGKQWAEQFWDKRDPSDRPQILKAEWPQGPAIAAGGHSSHQRAPTTTDTTPEDQRRPATGSNPWKTWNSKFRLPIAKNGTASQHVLLKQAVHSTNGPTTEPTSHTALTISFWERRGNRHSMWQDHEGRIGRVQMWRFYKRMAPFVLQIRGD